MIQDLAIKNGGKDWEDTRSVQQRPRRTELQKSRDEQYKNWSEKYSGSKNTQNENNWGRRTDKWIRKESDRNHYWGTE